MSCRYCQNGWFSVEPCSCYRPSLPNTQPYNGWPTYSWKECSKEEIEKYYKGFKMTEKETIKELEKKIIRAICKCEMYRDAYEDMTSIFEDIIKELS